MRERHRLSAMALGILLCSVIPAATYAQDRLERLEEQPRVVVDPSRDAVTTALQTAATGVAAREVARRKAASPVGIYVQLLPLPLGIADTGLADLVERRNRTEILVTLTEVPPDVVSPNLIAEIHEGTCLDLESGPVRASDEAAAGYSLTPLVFSSRSSFGAVLPLSLAALRSSAHAVTVRAGPEEGVSAFACIDVA
jgi:hypothetical protein